MDDYATSRIEDKFLSGDGIDDELAPDDVADAFEAKMEAVEQQAMEALDHRQKVNYAVSMMSADDLRSRRVGGSGEPTDLKILSIGHRGVFPDWGEKDVDTVMSHAIIRGPFGEGGEVKASKAILFNRKSEMDLLGVQQKYHALNEMEARYEVEEAWDLDGFMRCYSMDETQLVETDLDDLPSDRDAKNEMLRKMFPDVALADLAESGAGMSSYDPDSGFTRDWGVDIKRFTGTVADYYVPDDRSWGRYTLMDDSVTPEDIEDHEVALPSGEDAPIVGDSQNVPGLTVYCQPDYHMNYGQNSVLDVYGVVETNNNGQLVMRAAGVVPIIPTDMDDGESADENVKSTESSL